MAKHRVIRVGIIALAGLWAVTASGAGNRGLGFTHRGHREKTRMVCTDCHGMGPAERIVPNHQLCSICHETDEGTDADCFLCHTREDKSVEARAKLLTGDIRFKHGPHRAQDCTDCHYNGEELKNRMPDDPDSSHNPAPTCGLCHPDPDAGRLAVAPAMPFCVECHKKMGEARARCAVCHKSKKNATASDRPS